MSSKGDTEKLGERFGDATGGFVMAVISEPVRAKAERRAGQMHRASSLLAKDKLVKLASEVANIWEAAHRPPKEVLVIHLGKCLGKISGVRRTEAAR